MYLRTPLRLFAFWNHTPAGNKIQSAFSFCVLNRNWMMVTTEKRSSECQHCKYEKIMKVASSVLQTFSCVISQVIVSCEALILDRQFIYKKQTHTHTKKVTMANFQRLVCDGGIGIQQMSTIKAVFPSVSNCYWCRASKSTQKHTITNGHQQFTL